MKPVAFLTLLVCCACSPDAEGVMDAGSDAGRDAAVDPGTDAGMDAGTDAGTVKTSGVDFQFPGYLRNIVNQVYRRWHRPSGQASLRAEVQFLILRDGSISGFQFVKRSGNFGFDLEAQGAIEAAATAGAFGPLPDGYPADVLPVTFFFDPTSIR